MINETSTLEKESLLRVESLSVAFPKPEGGEKTVVNRISFSVHH